MNSSFLDATAAARFRDLAPLGEGGMGQVFRAYDTALGRAVALKVVHERLLEQPSARTRFRREAEAMARVRHPNVVQLFELGPAGARPWLAMELLEGEPLAGLLRRVRLPAAQALTLLAEVAEGLAALHAAGLLHRDVKSANVFVTREGTAKLMDLGLVRSADPREATALTRTGELVGSLAFIAPEVLAGGPASVRSDLFALGLVAHETLSGRQPEPPRDPRGLLAMAERAGDLPALGVEPEVDRLVRALLARDPARRPASAAAVGAALRAALPRLGAAPSPAAPPRPSSRSWAGAALAVAAMLAAVSAGAALLRPRAPAARVDATVTPDHLRPPTLQSLDRIGLSLAHPASGSLRWEVVRPGRGAPDTGTAAFPRPPTTAATAACLLDEPLLEPAVLRVYAVGPKGPIPESARSFPLDPATDPALALGLVAPLHGVRLASALVALDRVAEAALRGREAVPDRQRALVEALAQHGLPPPATRLLKEALPRLLPPGGPSATPVARAVLPLRFLAAALRGAAGLEAPWGSVGPLTGAWFQTPYQVELPPEWRSLCRELLHRPLPGDAARYERPWLATPSFQARVRSRDRATPYVDDVFTLQDDEVVPAAASIPTSASLTVHLRFPPRFRPPPLEALLALRVCQSLEGVYLTLALADGPAFEVVAEETSGIVRATALARLDPAWLRPGPLPLRVELREQPGRPPTARRLGLEDVRIFGRW